MLQKKDVSGSTSFGTPQEVWVDVDIVWCDISPASMSSMRGASETILAGAETPLDVVVITLYPYPGVTAAWRAINQDGSGRIYDLKAARETNDRSEMSFYAAFGASNG
jgi:head-tail adaptor